MSSVPGPARGEADDGALARRGILRLRADNPGPLTLSGTNTWVLGRGPAWVIDPGPLLDEHLVRILEAIDERGGLGGVALTHHHGDHSEAVQELLSRYPAPLAAGSGDADVRLTDEGTFGPLLALATPGHAEDHFALIFGDACFTGDAVLGEGSVFISPYRGAMSSYMGALARLRGREDIAVICPGHGPPVWDPAAKLDEYIAHRTAREDALREALADGLRSTGDLLDRAWPDVPVQLRPAAAVTLEAHLDKLEQEGALPAGVERVDLDPSRWKP
jgi:glyoxylase-like metal-dependent hydrolase (beta-lactamase superfamily II)